MPLCGCLAGWVGTRRQHTFWSCLVSGVLASENRNPMAMQHDGRHTGVSGKIYNDVVNKTAREKQRQIKEATAASSSTTTGINRRNETQTLRAQEYVAVRMSDAAALCAARWVLFACFRCRLLPRVCSSWQHFSRKTPTFQTFTVLDTAVQNSPHL